MKNLRMVNARKYIKQNGNKKKSMQEELQALKDRGINRFYTEVLAYN